MASTVPLNKTALKHLARQVGAFIDGGMFHIISGDKVELAESFPVWFFPAKAEYDKRPFASVTATGTWHHQIHVDGMATGYARSRVLGPTASDWELTSLVHSSLAGAIDNAISFVDKKDAIGAARLLLAPAWHLAAIWLYVRPSNMDSFVVVMLGKESFSEEARLLTKKEFIKLLRETPSMQGWRK